jgi:predicted phage terminase large subunit-like protein
MLFEDNGGQVLFTEIFADKAKEKGYRINYRAGTNTIHKDTLIEGTLSAPIENGIIWFDKTDSDQKELIGQLLQFPGGEYKDGSDALEGVVRKLQEYARKRRAGLPRTRHPREAYRRLEGYL